MSQKLISKVLSGKVGYSDTACTATWVGPDDFFFCEWEAENPQDVLDVLTKKGLDEYIFTAMYPIDMHIDVNNFTDKIPYKPIHYLDPEFTYSRNDS